MYKVAVLGNQDSVIGFRAVGMTVVTIEKAAEVAAAIDKLIADQHAIIFITEDLALPNEAYLASSRNLKLPAIIPIPSLQGSNGSGMRLINESVRRAVGIDLFDRDDE